MHPDVACLQSTEDTRIGDVRPLLPPACLEEEIELTPKARSVILAARAGCGEILDGKDDRLVVICGPCSIHDVKAAKEYGELFTTSFFFSLVLRLLLLRRVCVLCNFDLVWGC